jgi:hypothetical protein
MTAIQDIAVRALAASRCVDISIDAIEAMLDEDNRDERDRIRTAALNDIRSILQEVTS